MYTHVQELNPGCLVPENITDPHLGGLLELQEGGRGGSQKESMELNWKIQSLNRGRVQSQNTICARSLDIFLEQSPKFVYSILSNYM